MAGASAASTSGRTSAAAYDVPPGGGAFALPRLTVGLFLVPQDSHRIGLGGDRKRHIPLAAGDGWILPSGSEGVCEFDRPHSYLTLALDGDLLDEVGFERAADCGPVVGKLDPLTTGFVRNAASLADGARSLYRETMDIAAAAHLARVLQPLPQADPAISDRRLARALAYIHDNLARDISLDALASEAAMSRFHFARAFAKAVGRTPLQYVIHARIELAKLRLRTLDTPVAEIAFGLGYNDVSRFSRHFRRHVGVSPARFRDR